LKFIFFFYRSQYSDWTTRVLFQAGEGNFSLCQRVQTVSGTHPASYLMGVRRSFPGGKETEAWSWPLTLIYCRS